MAVIVANHDVLGALMGVQYHPMMISLAKWIVHRYTAPEIKSAWRPSKVHPADSGIHMEIPGRAIDWGIRHFENPQAVEDDINANWVYDPERPNMKCAIIHEVFVDQNGKKVSLGRHLHTQVHPKTYFKGGGSNENESG